MSGKQDDRLVATAVAAAAAGAALAIAAMKLSSRNEGNASHRMGDMHPSRASFIFEDPEHDANLSIDNPRGSTVLMPHQYEEKMRKRIAARVAVEDENLAPRNSVTVRVPATSANVGPGYDCIGMSVDLWSEITVTRAEKFEITAEGEGAKEMPKDETNLMCIGVKAAFDAANKPVPTLKYHCINRIPYARGLGSSSAAIVGGIIAGLILAGHRLPCWGSEALLQIAASIEGHPDNVAPAIYGGIQIGIHTGARWMSERAPNPPGMQLVMFIPDFVGKTSAARNVLQNNVTRDLAAYNIGRVAILVHSLCTSNIDNLRFGVQDKMHQPQRGEKLYKYLYPMIEAAQNAGAACAYLSGAGPTVMALTSGASGDIFTQREKERVDYAVADAMLQVAEQHGIRGKLLVTQATHEGAHVTKVTPPFSTDKISYRSEI
mmetsp:Transcript_16412/g.33005  ORF Transcript_16412/g.33005 Transcript_16412/m.33005 type:complete len:433 (-) Transcript_16412:757-2055(-)|eukprot:CAMPEP_0178481320 /NCGR_PEP_ID=MMETSP0696-20121128/6152_1 /TAXON_ID=265572 /ORGANISM="Extubocellulus spinifer, Strain CCMP396" /LENGTH=432 /DNA_ID=CAMNT_0020108791 /DNA_START=229 /DNA_END=1527 /DNA_ORIENTATION=+